MSAGTSEVQPITSWEGRGEGRGGEGRGGEGRGGEGRGGGGEGRGGEGRGGEGRGGEGRGGEGRGGEGGGQTEWLDSWEMRLEQSTYSYEVLLSERFV